MPSRIASAGAFTGTPSASVLSQFNNLPGGSIGYARITSNSNNWAGGTATAITGLSITVTVNSNRRIKIVAHGQIDLTVAAASADIYLFEGAGSFVRDRYGGGNGLAQDTMHLEYTDNVTAGSHTYFLKGDQVTGSADQHIHASTTAGTGAGPAWIEVFDIGPSY